MKEVWGSNVLIPLYDLDGTVCGIKYNGIAYYFYKNLQGDVIAITNEAGATIARYTYDAWGKVLSVTAANGADISMVETHVANINPFRYRGYYYDAEIGLYYLQSRYYDSGVGRFINADDAGYLFDLSDVIGANLYCYCKNNPTNNSDGSGNLSALKVAEIILSILVGVLKQLFSDLLIYLLRKYLAGKQEDFCPDPKDYIVAVISSILNCINPFSKKGRKLLEVIKPLVPVIINHVGIIIKEKRFDIKQFGADVFLAFLSNIVSSLFDFGEKQKIKKLGKKYNKRSYTFKTEKTKIEIKYRALGKKFEIGINISTELLSLVMDYFEK